MNFHWFSQRHIIFLSMKFKSDFGMKICSILKLRANLWTDIYSKIILCSGSKSAMNLEVASQVIGENNTENFASWTFSEANEEEKGKIVKGWKVLRASRHLHTPDDTNPWWRRWGSFHHLKTNTFCYLNFSILSLSQVEKTFPILKIDNRWFKTCFICWQRTIVWESVEGCDDF